MAKKRLLQFSLLLFLSSSCAWANNINNNGESKLLPPPRRLEPVPRELREERSEPLPLWRRLSSEAVEAVDQEEQIERLVVRIQEESHHTHHRPRHNAPSPAQLASDADRAQITPPPSLELLAKRQDDRQIADLSARIQSISDASRQVSQASQQVSQSSQQLSQSLQQAEQQLSQTQRELASVRAEADTARQSADAANRDADAASRSASSAISSAQSSASNAMAANLAEVTSSAGASAASVIAAASESAQSIMSSAASMVQQARADATAVRAEADTKVLEAQGTAVSVTQAAVAVVGATVASSLITIGAFVLVLRYKRNRKRRRTLRAAAVAADGISYPALNGSSNGYEPGAYESRAGFPADLKEPPAAAVAPDDSRTAVGFAASKYGEKASSGGGGPGPEFQLRTPPKGKFTLFPRSPEERDQRGLDAGRAASPNGSAGGDSESNYSVDREESSRQPQQQEKRASKFLPPSLDTWLRAGTVSPFATLNKNEAPAARRGPNWPLSRQV